MIRFIEKKNWRKNVESCWAVSNQINTCLNNSENFKNLDEITKSSILNSVNRNYILRYLDNWVDNPTIGVNEALYDNNSELWNNNRETLESLTTECNLLALNECCREKFNLDNLEGDYELFAQTLKKK